jgi:hypothetical protein
VDPLSLLWLFFVLASLQPALQRAVLENRRRLSLQKIARNRQATVITLIHRQETMSFLGFPIVRYIDIDDSESILRAIRDTPDGQRIEIVLHTPRRANRVLEQCRLPDPGLATNNQCTAPTGARRVEQPIERSALGLTVEQDGRPWTNPSAQMLVGGQGQELDELVAERDLLEDPACLLVALAELLDLLVGDPAHVVPRDLAVLEPLPHLRTGDLRCRDVLHQVEDRDRAGAAQPGGEVLDSN